MRINPLTAIDFYKADHRRQYPKGTTMVYSNLTARSDKLKCIPDALWTGCITFFGLQYFIKHFLIDTWNKEFFQRPLEEVLAAYKRRLDTSLGKDAVPVEHIEALHKLGYLPLCIKALPEGTPVPMKVPCLVMYNTHPDFFWLVNYLETSMSCFLWKSTTSATIARHYRILLENHAKQTGSPLDFVGFQAHDFSFRGMAGLEAAALSGAAHLTSFVGTDTVPAIDLIEDYYNGDATKELLGCSVPATEHSVMCMGGLADERETFRRIIEELYPTGIVSIVSDTWDFWKVLTHTAPQLKNHIMARAGKLVFRPDSGDPVKIIVGDPQANPATPAYFGAVELLWNAFGGTTNAAGFKVLDEHVGLIYGDSITLERAHLILKGLKAKGFAANNVVFGVGSFTYQHNTRDTFGFAVKSTYGEVDGVGRDIFKDPVTDNGVKKSARGRLRVTNVNGELVLTDQMSIMDDIYDCLRPVFKDGKLLVDDTIAAIRERTRQ